MKLRAIATLLALFATALFPGSAHPECFEYGHTLHSVGSVATSEALGTAVWGSSACISCVDGVDILDIHDYSRPRDVAHVNTGGTNEVAAFDGLFYVATCSPPGTPWPGSLTVLDLADPTNPRILGMVGTVGTAWGVAVADGTAYVTTVGRNSLQIIDVHDPNQPRVVGTIDAPNEAYGVAVAGDYVYVGNGSGLMVVNLHGPGGPKIVGNGDVTAICVAARDSYVYANGGNGNGTDGFLVYDVSDPSRPTVVAQVPLPGFTNPGEVRLMGNYAYVTGPCLWVFDISDPLHPVLVNHCPLHGFVFGVGLAAPGYACVATNISETSTGEVTMMDITDPQESQPLWQVDLPDNAFDVVAEDGYAYVADGQAGLQIVRYAPPEEPAVVGAAYTWGLSQGVAKSGPRVYLASSLGYLQAVDVSDPTNPQDLGYPVQAPGPASDVKISGHCAYLAAGSGGLAIYDVSPERPLPVATLDTPGNAVGVAVSGDTAYVADTGTLLVIDVSDPMHPVEIGSLPTQDTVRGVVVSGSVAYLTGDAGLTSVDVSDPAHPHVLDFRPTIAGAPGLALDQGYAYLSANGLHVIDARDPANLSAEGSLWTPGGTGKVSVADGIVCVAGGHPFLYARPLQCPATSVPPAGSMPAAGAIRMIPNPVRGSGWIRIESGPGGAMQVALFDLAGRKVRRLFDGRCSAGALELLWDGHDDAGRELPSGVYLTRIETAAGVRTGKITLAR